MKKSYLYVLFVVVVLLIIINQISIYSIQKGFQQPNQNEINQPSSERDAKAAEKIKLE